MERLRQRADFLAAATGAKAPAAAFVLQARHGARRDRRASGLPCPRRSATRSSATACGGGCGRSCGCHRRPAMRPGHDYVLIGRRTALERAVRADDGGFRPGAAARARRAAKSGSQWHEPRRDPTCGARLNRARNDRPEEHHPRHRAVGARADRLAVFRRHAADGEAAAGGAAQAAAADPAAASASRRRASRASAPGSRPTPQAQPGAPPVPGQAPPVAGQPLTREAVLAASPARRDRDAALQRLDLAPRRPHRRPRADAVPRDRRSEVAADRAAVAVRQPASVLRRVRLGRRRRAPP